MRPTPGATAAIGGCREGVDEEFTELASLRLAGSVSGACGCAPADGDGVGAWAMGAMLMKCDLFRIGLRGQPGLQR